MSELSFDTPLIYDWSQPKRGYRGPQFRSPNSRIPYNYDKDTKKVPLFVETSKKARSDSHVI